MHAAGTDEAGRPFCSRYIRHVSFLPLASVTRISNARMRRSEMKQRQLCSNARRLRTARSCGLLQKASRRHANNI